MGKSSFMMNLGKIWTKTFFVIKIVLNKYFTELKNYKITSEYKRSIGFNDLLISNLFKFKKVDEKKIPKVEF